MIKSKYAAVNSGLSPTAADHGSRVARRWWVVALVALLAGCSSSLIKHRDDPLVGRIVRSSDAQELSFGQLVAAAAASDVVYLGEKHDNVTHHDRQLEILRALVAQGLRPAIGFEFFDVGQTGHLNQFVQGTKSTLKLAHRSKPEDEERLLRLRLGWQDVSDQKWRFYFQLIDFAREHSLPVFGADLPAAIRKRISRVGIDGLNGVERGLLTPSGYQDDDYRKLMYDAFRRSHCGWGEEPLLRRLYQTWVARNDRMAASVVQMAQSTAARPLVVILGNGHVQHDQGVFERVAALAPELRQLNVGFREVSREPTPLADYLATTDIDGRRFAPDHQLLWFSQRQDYRDPCEGLR